MKKLLTYGLGILFMFIGMNAVFADSSMYDYTYIDCHNGNDVTAEPFNSAKPYNTLQNGIQNSINYINNNWNTPNNTTNVAGKRFVIKVKSGCVFDGYNQNMIDLGFYGKNYKDDLLITSDDDNHPFGVKNLYFTNNNGYWNGLSPYGIIFQNVDFMEPSTYYFLMASAGGIAMTIQNSVINIKPQQSQTILYQQPYYGYSTIIKNSIIQVDSGEGDTSLTIPGHLFNSKINFTVPTGKSGRLLIYGYTLLGNIVDVNHQNLYIANESISNKFINVNSFGIAGSSQIFLNNTIQNASPVSTNNWIYTCNNIFTGGYTDNNDTPNLRRNFSAPQDNVGIGWIYKKWLGTYMEINYSDRTLYKEMTGNDLGSTNSPIYLIFQ